MIKSTCLLPVALLMLAGCSQEEPITGPDYGYGARIIFRTSPLPEVISRAKIVSVEDIDEFHVTAFNPSDTDTQADGNLSEYINDEVLKKDGNSGFFASDNCQWPKRGHESDVLTFFAYYPARDEGTTLENASTVTGNAANFDYRVKNFRVAADIADQVDFVTAYATGTMDDNMFSGISLEFRHKLSRIEVRAKSSNKSCKLEIAGIRIGGLYPQGTYNFKAEDEAGDWTIDQSKEKENVEYIYRPKDKIVALDNTENGVSIMGGTDGANYAMLIPGSYNGWDFTNDHTNSGKGMFISVLLRVLDKTPGGNDKQQYPYYDNSQGVNAMNIERVYLAVDNNGIVTANPGKLYKGGDGKYYTDSAMETEYTAPQGSIVKEFGWAALPVTANWEAGYAYTYTLDYTSGVGLHDPSVQDPQDLSGNAHPGPKAGDPIISDRVGISVSVNDWQGLNGSTTHTVEVPGS